MKTVRRPPYPKWNPGYFPCSSLTPLPLSSRRPSVSFGGFGLKELEQLPAGEAHHLDHHSPPCPSDVPALKEPEGDRPDDDDVRSEDEEGVHRARRVSNVEQRGATCGCYHVGSGHPSGRVGSKQVVGDIAKPIEQATQDADEQELGEVVRTRHGDPHAG